MAHQMSQVFERVVCGPLQPLAILDVGMMLPELLIFFKLEIGLKFLKQYCMPNKTYLWEACDLILTLHMLSQILQKTAIVQTPKNSLLNEGNNEYLMQKGILGLRDNM